MSLALEATEKRGRERDRKRDRGGETRFLSVSFWNGERLSGGWLTRATTRKLVCFEPSLYVCTAAGCLHALVQYVHHSEPNSRNHSLLTRSLVSEQQVLLMYAVRQEKERTTITHTGLPARLQRYGVIYR